MADNLGSSAPPARGYPWADWLNGDWWHAVAGHDYVCTTDSFRSQLYMKGKEVNRRVSTRVASDPAGVQFQFAPSGS